MPSGYLTLVIGVFCFTNPLGIGMNLGLTPGYKRSQYKRPSENQIFRRPLVFSIFLLQTCQTCLYALCPKVSRSIQYGFDDTCTDGKISKTFLIQTVSRPICHPAFDNFKDFRFGNIFFKQARNAGAFAVAACVKVVAADGFADQTYFRQHDAAATVGATGYAQNDYSSSKPVLRLIYKKAV